MKKALIIIGFLLVAVSLMAAEERETTFVYDSKGRRDPFLPLVSSEGYLINAEPYSDASEVKVEGIIYDPRGNSFAIINTQVVRIGEKVGAFEVLKIEKDKVTLLKDTEKFEIYLKEGR